MNKKYKGQARAAIGFVLIQLEESEFSRSSDWRDYVVDEDDGVMADRERSQSDYLKTYYSLLEFLNTKDKSIGSFIVFSD